MERGQGGRGHEHTGGQQGLHLANLGAYNDSHRHRARTLWSNPLNQAAGMGLRPPHPTDPQMAAGGEHCDRHTHPDAHPLLPHFGRDGVVVHLRGRASRTCQSVSEGRKPSSRAQAACGRRGVTACKNAQRTDSGGGAGSGVLRAASAQGFPDACRRMHTRLPSNRACRGHRRDLGTVQAGSVCECMCACCAKPTATSTVSSSHNARASSLLILLTVPSGPRYVACRGKREPMRLN